MADHRLTRREVQCVLLAGEGLTNKEIAQRLKPSGAGMSHRTVGNHLASAYQKLGTTNRVDAAGLVAQNYPDRPIPMAPAAPPPSSAGVPAGSQADPQDSDAGPLYRAYMALGPWRTPPRIAGSRLPVILIWTLTGVVAISAALGLITVFGSANQVGQNAYAVPLEVAEK
jgi:DNA-binding CsgD family transcriptional regulator